MYLARVIEVLNRRYISDIQGINDDLISELRIPKQKNCGCAK